jgi:hypothetical protein
MITKQREESQKSWKVITISQNKNERLTKGYQGFLLNVLSLAVLGLGLLGVIGIGVILEE